MLTWCVQGLTVFQISQLRDEHKRTTERFIDKVIADLHCGNCYEAILQCERWGYLDVMNGDEE